MLANAGHLLMRAVYCACKCCTSKSCEHGAMCSKSSEHGAMCTQILRAWGNMHANSGSMGRCARKHLEHGAICRQTLGAWDYAQAKAASTQTNPQANPPALLCDKRVHRIAGLQCRRSDNVQLRKTTCRSEREHLHTSITCTNVLVQLAPPCHNYPHRATRGGTSRSLRPIVRSFARVCAKRHSGTKNSKNQMVQKQKIDFDIYYEIVCFCTVIFNI